MKQQSFYSRMATGALLMALPGCFLDGDKKAKDVPVKSSDGEPLICFHSKPVFTVEDFKQKLEMLYKTNPGVSTVLASMPVEEQEKVYKQLAEGCASEQLIAHYTKDKGLLNTAEYQEMSRQAHEALESQLKMQVFQNDLIQQVEKEVAKMSEDELKTFYDMHRDTHHMMQGEPFVRKQKNKEDKKKEYAPFAEVRDAIKQVILQHKLGELYQLTLDGLKEKYGLTVEEACLRRFIVKPAPMPSADSSTTDAAGASEQRTSAARVSQAA